MKPRTSLIMIGLAVLSVINLSRMLNAGADRNAAFTAAANFIGIWIIAGLVFFLDKKSK